MYLLKTAIEEFLKHCQFEKVLNEKSLKAYQTDLKQLVEFFAKENYSYEVANISKIELKGFIESLSALKAKSIKRKITTVKSMFNFMEFEDKITANPFRKMNIKIREPKSLPKVMNIDEISNILNIAYNRIENISDKESYAYFETIRNIVIIELLFNTGGRVTEIAKLKMCHIDMHTNSILIQGKGNRERLIQICNAQTIEVLRQYMEIRKNRVDKDFEYLFTNRLGNNISEQSVRNIIKIYSKKAGIIRNITPHVFRHSFATLLLEQDVDIKYIQSLLGHSSIITTQIYTHVNKEKLNQLLSQKHPRRNIVIEHDFLVS